MERVQEQSLFSCKTTSWISARSMSVFRHGDGQLRWSENFKEDSISEHAISYPLRQLWHHMTLFEDDE